MFEIDSVGCESTFVPTECHIQVDVNNDAENLVTYASLENQGIYSGLTIDTQMNLNISFDNYFPPNVLKEFYV